MDYDIPNLEEQTSSEKAQFSLGTFQGPLDLLLFLIKKNEVNVYDIPIAEITKQYLEYMEYITKINLENVTEFYWMAATLLYIKSRMLLPVELNIETELEDPRKELVEQLIEYQKYKKLSELIEEKEHEVEWVVERKKEQRLFAFSDDEELWEKLDVWDLLQCFSTIISSISSEKIIDLHEEVTVNEKIVFIFELLEQKEEFLFTEIIRSNSIMDVICAFLAILELVKTKRISLFQNKMFGDIRIKRNIQEMEYAVT